MAISGFDTARLCEKKGWLWGIVSGLVYAVLLILVSTLIFNRSIFNSQTFIIIILAIASGGFGGTIGINFKK
jgi:putative membrane protein (TIGR04086 family)